MIRIDDVYDRCPRLEASPHCITSPPRDNYNCVAWLRRDLEHWWQPEFHWPRDLPCPPVDEPDVACYMSLFERWGYTVCDTPELEEGYLKIALYAEGGFFHHVAKQLPSGAWSSKVGKAHDLKHGQLEALYDSMYFAGSSATQFMKRSHDPAEDFSLEHGQVLLP